MHGDVALTLGRTITRVKSDRDADIYEMLSIYACYLYLYSESVTLKIFDISPINVIDKSTNAWPLA